MLPPDALLHRLDLAIRTRITGHQDGDVYARGIGGGIELDQVREWTPGDDWRLLEPSATARTGRPHVRVPVAERRPTVWIGVDVSSSMAFGTGGVEKHEVAVAASATFGLVGLRQGGRVGGLPLGGDNRVMPPRAGRPGLLSLLESVRPERTGASTDLAAGLGTLAGIMRGRCVVVVASDFRGGLPAPPDALRHRGRRGRRRRLSVVHTEPLDRSGPLATWTGPLARLASRHDVFCVEVHDPREEELPDVGIARFTDPETGEMHTVDTASSDLRSRFSEIAAFRRDVTASSIRHAGADHIRLSTRDDWLDVLARHLENRRRNRWVSATR